MDAATRATFEGLSGLAAAPPSPAPTVHGLKRLGARDLRRLPFSFGGGQAAYTCVCGSGWLTISGGDAGPEEAYRAHVEGARSSRSGSLTLPGCDGGS